MEKETISLNTILVKYLRRWKLFLAVFVLSFIPAILYLAIFPRTYKFAASILLQENRETGMSSLGLGNAANLMKSFGIGAASVSSLNIDDEMEILTSNRLQRMMLLRLGINTVYSAPFSLYKMYREAPLRLIVDSATMANLQDEVRMNITVSPGKIKVKTKTVLGKWKANYVFSSLPATMKVGEELFTLDYDYDVERESAFKLNIKCQPASWMAEKVNKKLEIEDVSSASNVLTITYTDHSRQRGLDMLNTLIQIYNDDMESYQRKEDLKTMKFVDDRIALILPEIEKVESELQDFKTKNEMTLLEADVSLYSEQYKSLQTALIETQMKAYQIDLLDDYLKDTANRNKAIPSVFSVDEGEKGVVIQYNKAIVTRERLVLNSNEHNPMVLLADQEVTVLRESVHVMIDNARKSISKTLDDLKNKENQLLTKFRSVPEKEREYIGYVRDQEILNGIYLLMLQKREETLLALGKHVDRARMIDPPYIIKKPIAPRKLYAGIGILALTLIVPVGYLFAKDLIASIKAEYRKN